MIIFSHILFYEVTFRSHVLVKQFNRNVITLIYNVTMEIHLNHTVDTQILWQIPPKNGFDLETISLSKTSSAFMTASKNSLSMF